MEHRQRISQTRKDRGYKPSIEACRKGGAIAGRLVTDRRRRDGSFHNFNNTGRKHSESARQKMRDARARSSKKARHTSPHSKQTRATLRAATLKWNKEHLGVHTQKPRHTDESKAKMSAARSEALRASAAKFRPSSLELTTRLVLDALGIEYVPQKRLVDFIVDIYIPSRQLVIECDGSYWHSRPGMPERDAERDRRLIAAGYAVLRLPENEIKSGRSAVVLSEVFRSANG